MLRASACADLLDGFLEADVLANSISRLVEQREQQQTTHAAVAAVERVDAGKANANIDERISGSKRCCLRASCGASQRRSTAKGVSIADVGMKRVRWLSSA